MGKDIYEGKGRLEGGDDEFINEEMAWEGCKMQ